MAINDLFLLYGLVIFYWTIRKKRETHTQLRALRKIWLDSLLNGILVFLAGTLLTNILCLLLLLDWFMLQHAIIISIAPSLVVYFPVFN